MGEEDEDEYGDEAAGARTKEEEYDFM